MTEQTSPFTNYPFPFLRGKWRRRLTSHPTLCRGSGRPGQGWVRWPPNIWSWG